MHVGEFAGQALCSVTALTASTTSQIIARPDDNRIGLLLYNHAPGALFLKLGNSATVTSFTVKIASGSYYELPLPVHSGTITGLHDAAGGHVMITLLSRK